MLLNLFVALRNGGLPVSVREFLVLLEALNNDVCESSVDAFYFLSRAALVKDEAQLDRFDQIFASVFRGITAPDTVDVASVPEEWLKKLAEKVLSPEEMAQIEALGGFDKLMDTLRQRLAEQEGRHQGGSKWIGTAGTSPFGAYGYNPEGVRIGQSHSRHRRAVKVWDQRKFRDLDNTVEIGTRNIKVALKRLRKFARSGAQQELDLDETITSTARQGYLDVQMRPERRNAVKVLLFFDVGGSMDDHVKVSEELFSAARTEFKTMEYFYFHNCLYEYVWKSNARRHSERLSTVEILRTYGADYKVVFVGDASMSPYEIVYAGGANEHWNDEAGSVWLGRIMAHFPKVAWLNPVEQNHWSWTQSIGMIRDLCQNRMYPLTVEGLDSAMRDLSR